MRFKKATQADIKSIADIEWKSGYKWNENKREVMKRAKELFDKEHHFVYIMQKEEPIGYFAITCSKNGKIGYIDNFEIKKKYQGKGLSKTMMKKAINILKKLECSEIELEVWGKNFPAISLYNKFGFYVTDITKNKYSNGDAKLFMRKELK